MLFSHGASTAPRATPPRRRCSPACGGPGTKPIIDSLNQEIERRIRSRTQATRLDDRALAKGEDLRAFSTSGRSLSERRMHAYGVAAEGTPEAIAALLAVLETAPPEDKAFICSSSEARAIPP